MPDAVMGGIGGGLWLYSADGELRPFQKNGSRQSAIRPLRDGRYRAGETLVPPSFVIFWQSISTVLRVTDSSRGTVGLSWS